MTRTTQVNQSDSRILSDPIGILSEFYRNSMKFYEIQCNPIGFRETVLYLDPYVGFARILVSESDEILSYDMIGLYYEDKMLIRTQLRK